MPADLDGRLLNHLPYSRASDKELVPVPSRFRSGGCQRVHRDVYPALIDLLSAAAGDLGPDNGLYGVSCFRTLERQYGLFCREGRDTDEVLRAEVSAPPGYSEHATGYAIDFGDFRRAGCDVQACFATGRAGIWLRTNAPRYGFEMSFPPGNQQGVTEEPWHWRWVGTPAYIGANLARDRFEVARSRFPTSTPAAPNLPPGPNP